MKTKINPYKIAIPQSDLNDLVTRLRLTRWPEEQTSDDAWQQGVPLERAKSLIKYWENEYDWRRCESALNEFDQFTTEIDGLPIHFIHQRSPHEGAMPLIITHGWPGSILEFKKVIGPLVDPVAYGGNVEDAFHVIAPSLPGYGFSGKPTQTGWGVEKIAKVWVELMNNLGYQRYVAQGGDWGSAVTTEIGKLNPKALAAIHLNFIVAFPNPDEVLNDEDQESIDAFEHYQRVESAYAALQITRPQTIGYSLADSPLGQAMWIYEKFQRWSDCDGDPETIFSRDELLDNIMIYWLTNAGASSARLYAESFDNAFKPSQLECSVGCTIYPHEIVRPRRRWAERLYSDIIHWNETDKGGHFAAMEQPDIFVNDLRTCFRNVR